MRRGRTSECDGCQKGADSIPLAEHSRRNSVHPALFFFVFVFFCSSMRGTTILVSQCRHSWLMIYFQLMLRTDNGDVTEQWRPVSIEQWRPVSIEQW